MGRNSNSTLVWTLLVVVLLITAYNLATTLNSSSETKPVDPNAKTQTLPEQFLTKLVYQSRDGRLKIFDTKTRKESETLVVGPITDYLWSKDGQLAVLVQNKPSLYLVDLESDEATLVLREVFGEVFWAADGQDFYVSENYFNGQPLFLGNQSGLEPTAVKTFLVSLGGVKQPIPLTEFEVARGQVLSRFSPDGKHRLVSQPQSDLEILQASPSGQPFYLKPGPGFKGTKAASWSPEGSRIAFLETSGPAEPPRYRLTVLELQDLLNGKENSKRPWEIEAEQLGFEWVDEKSILVTELTYLAREGYYQGRVGLVDVAAGSYSVLIPAFLQRVPKLEAVSLSPDKNFLVHQASRFDLFGQTSLEEVVLWDVRRALVVKKFEGSAPSWQPVSQRLRAESQIRPDWQLYRSALFSLNLPPTWKLFNEGNPTRLVNYDPSSIDRYFDPKLDSGKLRIEIYQEETSEGLANYVAKQKENILQIIKSPDYWSQRETSLSGQPAIFADTPLLGFFVFTKHPTLPVVLSLSFQLDFDNYLKVAQDMLATFKFVE